MKRNQILIILGALLVLMVGMVVFTYIKQKQLNARDVVPLKPEAQEIEKKRIDAKHFFSSVDSVHTLAGEIAMPTPCDLLNYTPRVTEEGAKVTVAFTVVNNSGNECPQGVTTQRFTVSFSARDDAHIEATYNSNPAELNLFPAAEGESPQNFELLIKG